MIPDVQFSVVAQERNQGAENFGQCSESLCERKMMCRRNITTVKRENVRWKIFANEVKVLGLFHYIKTNKISHSHNASSYSFYL